MTPLHQRPGLWAAVVLVGLVGAIYFRVASSSRHELTAAQAQREGGNADLAIEHYRRAIRWHAPLNPHSAKARSELEALARQLEADGQRGRALRAWRSLSGGVAAARFLYSGEDPARSRANAEIARLMALDRNASIDRRLTEEQLAADHLRLLEELGSPSPWWTTLLLLGMAAWVGALFVMAWRGFDSSGRFEWASARVPLLSALVGFVSFALGLLFA